MYFSQLWEPGVQGQGATGRFVGVGLVSAGIVMPIAVSFGGEELCVLERQKCKMGLASSLQPFYKATDPIQQDPHPHDLITS